MMLLLCSLQAFAGEVLPLERVRFYEIGVAWFERRGEVEDSAAISLPVSHMDDALKSLMILGGDAGVGAVTFASRTDDKGTATVAGVSSALGYIQGIRALVGEEVGVSLDAEEVLGTLLDVSEALARTAPADGEVARYLQPEHELSVLAQDGRLLRIGTQEVRSIRALDPAVLERIRAVAHTRSPTTALRSTELDVHAWRGGNLRLGYLSEAPVWRVTWRLDLPETVRHTEAELQGWSLVHNDTSEDWEGVTVELCNGEPDSFLYPLVAPRYRDRGVRVPERWLSTVPQLSRTTADNLWQPDRGSSGAGGLGSRGSGHGGGGFASGYASPGATVTGSPATVLRAATPLQTPTQFIYKVDHPLDLPARHSALVPILQAPIAARAVTVLKPRDTQPRHGAWLENNTRRTLPAGPLAVTAFGGLSGEAELVRLEPEATQMVWFGTELDLDIRTNTESASTTLQSLVFSGSELVLEERERQLRHLSVTNRSGREREIWWALELGPDAQIGGSHVEHVDRQYGWTWVELPTGLGAVSHTVEILRPRSQRFDPAEVPEAVWHSWADAGLADVALLNRAAGLRRRIREVDATLSRLEEETGDASQTLASLRTDLDASDVAEGALVRKVAQVETGLERLQNRARTARESRRTLVEELHELLQPLVQP